MGQNPDLELVKEPQAFFYELISDAMSRQNFKPQPQTELYLVNLLNQFMTSENLYIRDSEGNMREEPLALLVKEALEEEKRLAQRLLFRYVGDISLYVAGFFQESLDRKMVALDYYIDMGGVAYSQVSAREDEKDVKDMFDELSESFGKFVNVLADVSEKTLTKSEKNLVRIYDLWLKTNSTRAKKVLQEAGINPKK